MRHPWKKLFLISASFAIASWSSALLADNQPAIDSATQILLDTQATAARRIKAAKILGTFEDPQAIEALVISLDKSGESLRDVVIEILQQGKGVEILAKRAVDSNLSVEQRVLAVRGLRVMKNPAGFPALKSLLSSPTDQLRLEAAWALSLAGAASAEAELIRALDDPNKDVRYFVADALFSVKSPAAIAALKKRKGVETDPTVLYVLRKAD